ncbi:hypothetical protein SEA_NOSHOW_73 [Mycobacterium phage NoShow]|nr:hypothetical protein SEA_NOSHOW_73 [Mycobacterium phage NoShow]
MASNRTARKADKRPPFAWKQPVCTKCWVDIKLKTGNIDKAAKMQHHFCCFCRADIMQGVDTYMIRLNPGTVPYPTVRKEEDA